MTKQELFDAVAWEAKLLNNDEAYLQLDSILQDATIFLGQTHPELLLLDPVSYDLELDNPTGYVECLGIDRVQISTGEGLEPYDIPHEDQVVGPAVFENWPKYYSIDGNATTSEADPKGLRVTLIPALTEPNAEILIVTYKKVPVLTEATHIVPPSWIPFLKKELVSRLSLQRAKMELDVAKAQMAGAGQALQAHRATESDSVAPSN